MKGTFDNYFLGYTFVSAIVAVFDPRTNLEFVCYLFRYLYGDSTEKTVIHDALGYIFYAYAKNLSCEGFTCSFINNDIGSSSYGDNPRSILDISGKNCKEVHEGQNVINIYKSLLFFLMESLTYWVGGTLVSPILIMLCS